MSFLEHGDKTVINRVLIRSRPSDPPGVQRRVADLLATARWDTHLSHSAMLCIRKLCDPLPGAHWFDRNRVGLSPEWEQALTTELNRVASVAVRPVSSPVPASVEAVLFLDQAEMSACVARDWLTGTLRTNWWWSALIRRQDPAEFVFKQWVEFPQLVPAALEVLARGGHAGRFLQQLGEGAAAQVLDNVLRCHGIAPAILTTSHSAAEPESPGNSSHGIGPAILNTASVKHERFDSFGFPEEMETESDTSGSAAPADPWLPWVMEASIADLPIVARALLGFALLLRRSPATAYSRTFHARFSSWYQYQSAARAKPTSVKSIEVRRSRTAFGEIHLSEDPAISEEIPLSPASTGVPNKGARDSSATPYLEEPAIWPDLDFSSFRNRSASPGGRQLPTLESGDPALSPDSPQFSSEEGISLHELCPLEVAPGERSVETSFGGIFFLLNVAIHLGYYADFTVPVDTCLELNMWDFLTLMALEFCDSEAFDADNIRTLFAQLAGRSEFEAPGSYFHPLGESLQQWITRTSSEIRETLRQALDRDDGPEFLCRLPARVAQTLVRIDVYFSLNDHPIEIRMAGLDRDPGWIPAAGRYVNFHFD